MSYNQNFREKRNYHGYFLPNNPIIISLIAIFGALICILTFLIRIPVPATGGYINIGDLGVMFTGLLFGPIIGGFAGGLGSAIADLLGGYPEYAIWTFLIKGLEGFLVGLISNPKKKMHKVDYKDIISLIIGGIVLISGYFLVETFFFGGLIPALGELPGNSFQFLFGSIGSIVLIVVMRKNAINNLSYIFDKIFLLESIEEP